MTKEELLQKGVSEDVADEIISAFEDGGQENSLSLLEKALNKGSDKQESLFKAEEEGEEKEEKESKKEEGEEEEEGEDKDYDEKYMKKYMKRYMKENKKACSKAAKEVGMFNDEMKKAMDDIDTGAEGAVVEMNDLAPYLNAQRKFNDTMAKAIKEISSQVILISSQNEQSFDLMEKAARVQVEQAKAIDGVFSQPQGRKGVMSSAVQPMAKAVDQFVKEDNTRIYSVLMKAVKTGDRTAGQVISVFESCGKNANKLNITQRQYVSELLNKEAH
jgi:hypothetical protein